MEEQFISYKQASKLKEIGFAEECIAEYDISDRSIHLIESFDSPSINKNEFLTAPLWQQAFDWFRSKGLRFSIVDDHSNSEKPHSFTTDHEYYYDTGTGNPWYKTYKEARQACLEKLIKIIENGKA